MKTKILHPLVFVCLLACSFGAKAQPVLTQQSNGLKAGYYLYANTNGITMLPATGKNITWDYSGINPDTIYTYTDTGETFYALDTFSYHFINPPTNNPHLTALFPQANIFEAETNTDDSGNVNGYYYEAFKTSASGFQYYGYIDEDTNLNVLDTTFTLPAENIISYPFTYGSSQTSLFTEYDYDNPYYDTIYTVDSTRGIAYGTLKLPGKTYTNVLVSQIKETYSDGEHTYYEYDFWAPGYGLPVLFVSFDSTGAVRYAEYYTNNSTLPLNLLSFTGQMQHNNALLNWQTTNEINTQSFTVERSANGTSFTPLGSVPATDAPGTNNYSYTDAKPLEANNYYRLKMYDKDGAFTYSRIVLVNNGAGVFALQVQPNPAVNTAMLRFNSLTAGKYSVTVAGMDGKTIKRLNGFATTGANTLQLDINGLARGVYMVTFTSADGTGSMKLVKE